MCDQFELEERGFEKGGRWQRVSWEGFCGIRLQKALNPKGFTCYDTINIPNYITYTNKVLFVSYTKKSEDRSRTSAENL